MYVCMYVCMYVILTLGPNVYKQDLHWAIWEPKGMMVGCSSGSVGPDACDVPEALSAIIQAMRTQGRRAKSSQ